MTDAVVTVVRCGKCGRTGDLALLDNRFWCAWCQDWASLTSEAVENAIVEKEDGRFFLVWHGNEFISGDARAELQMRTTSDSDSKKAA